MKLYIAAKFDKKEKVRELYRMLKEKGHEITADWTSHKFIKPYKANPDIARKYSAEDMEGVRNCDIFILITDREKGSGCHVELGGAILLNLLYGKPKIYVVGEYNSLSMFYFHPCINRKENIEEVLAEIESL